MYTKTLKIFWVKNEYYKIKKNEILREAGEHLINEIRSKYNPLLTLDYMTTNEEKKFFDRKSAQIKPSEISDLISAFANAEGETIIIGISDKTKRLEGIKN